ncbi:hypothetical protein C8J57DRAFT_1510909 [Mycena rebaudengoi]|nr:hypothetical protein C8J57DRAFT_1510909 [Mycena rebaudengoi]
MPIGMSALLWSRRRQSRSTLLPNSLIFRPCAGDWQRDVTWRPRQAISMGYMGMGAPAAVADVSPLSFHPSEQQYPPAARMGDTEHIQTEAGVGANITLSTGPANRRLSVMELCRACTDRHQTSSHPHHFYEAGTGAADNDERARFARLGARPPPARPALRVLARAVPTLLRRRRARAAYADEMRRHQAGTRKCGRIDRSRSIWRRRVFIAFFAPAAAIATQQLQQLRRQAQYLPAFDTHPQTHPRLGLEMEAMVGYPHGIGTDLGTRSGCFCKQAGSLRTLGGTLYLLGSSLRGRLAFTARTPDFAPVSAAATRCRWRALDCRVYYTPPNTRTELEDMRKGIGCAETRSVVRRKTARTDVRIEDLAINVLVENVAVDVHFEDFGCVLQAVIADPPRSYMGGGGGGVCACPRLLELKYCLFELKHRVSGIAVLDVVEGSAIEALPHMLRLRTARPDRFDSTRASTGSSTPRAPTRFDSPKDAIDVKTKMGAPPGAPLSAPTYQWPTPLWSTTPYWARTFSCFLLFFLPLHLQSSSLRTSAPSLCASLRLVVCGPRLLDLKYRLLELNHRVSGVTVLDVVEGALRNAPHDGNLCTARSDGNLCNGRLIGFDSPDAAIQRQCVARLPFSSYSFSFSSHSAPRPPLLLPMPYPSFFHRNPAPNIHPAGCFTGAFLAAPAA